MAFKFPQVFHLSSSFFQLFPDFFQLSLKFPWFFRERSFTKMDFRKQLWRLREFWWGIEFKTKLSLKLKIGAGKVAAQISPGSGLYFVSGSPTMRSDFTMWVSLCCGFFFPYRALVALMWKFEENDTSAISLTFLQHLSAHLPARGKKCKPLILERA